MAFTRNGSTREDYGVEQCSYLKRYNYTVADLGFVVNDRETVLLPGFGVYSMTNVPKNYMAKNAVDIESVLRGIRANDFVRGDSFKADPEVRGLGEVEFFKRPDIYSRVESIPCVNPYYQERERPDYY